MDDFMKLLLASAMQDAMKKSVPTSPYKKPDDQKKEESFEVLAEEVAKNNRQLYEAHIKVGFTNNEAFALTRTLISRK